jgi:hypothetical protein
LKKKKMRMDSMSAKIIIEIMKVEHHQLKTRMKVAEILMNQLLKIKHKLSKTELYQS